LSTAGVRVALDGHALQVEGWADRGVGRYIVGYAEALARQGALAAVVLDPHLPPPSGLSPEFVFSGRAEWDVLARARAVAERGPLVRHNTAPFLHFESDPELRRPDHWDLLGVARVTLLYDLIPLRAPRHYLAASGYEERYRRRAEWVAGSDLILTISSHTRSEAIELLDCDPGRVVNIGTGASSYFSPPDGTDEELFEFHFPGVAGRPFLLTVGGSDARKGGERAVAALGRLVERGYDLCLIVAGHLTEDWRRRLRETAGACGVSGRVFLGGAVSDELLRAAYRRAEMTLMPSLAEGAGLPLLESAACGTPALASGGTALGDTAASELALFDPTDLDSITECVEAALRSPARRARILAAQRPAAADSTWDAVATRAIEAIGMLPGRAPATLAPRLALVGGDAYVRSIFEQLAAGWPATLDFVDPSRPGTHFAPAGYDSVTYVLVPGDRGAIDRAARHPGWLWIRPGRRLSRSELEPLARRSLGILVSDRMTRSEVELALRPLAARPPVVLLSPGDEVAALTRLLAPVSAAGGRLP
jgi:glycosyltransferase involved in cell wall biosynthesis